MRAASQSEIDKVLELFGQGLRQCGIAHVVKRSQQWVSIVLRNHGKKSCRGRSVVTPASQFSSKGIDLDNL